jgi:hypothetical protein
MFIGMKFVKGGNHASNGGVGEGGSLRFIYEVYERTDCMDESRGRHTHNSGDKCSLDVTMITSSHLIDVRYTIGKMTGANTFMLAAEPRIQLVRAYHLLAPLQYVIEEKLVACVQYLGDEEYCRVCKLPVTPIWELDATKGMLLGQLLKLPKLPGICDVAEPMQLL